MFNILVMYNKTCCLKPSYQIVCFCCPCRILYRSRQRGYLELDLLLGKWAEDNINNLDENRLQELVDLLEGVRI